MFFCLCSLFVCNASVAQIDWLVDVDKDDHKLFVEAKLQEGWHVYSQHQNPNDGPLPTRITLQTTDKELTDFSEPQPIAKIDSNYQAEVLYFEEHVRFEREIRSEMKGDAEVEVVYMICNAEGCLPPSKKVFTVSLD